MLAVRRLDVQEADLKTPGSFPRSERASFLHGPFFQWKKGTVIVSAPLIVIPLSMLSKFLDDRFIPVFFHGHRFVLIYIAQVGHRDICFRCINAIACIQNQFIAHEIR